MKLNTFILLLANKVFLPKISLAECLCDLERRAIARRPSAFSALPQGSLETGSVR
jgi:hypothetical protein